MKLIKIWYMFAMTVIMLTVLFALFIPSMYLNCLFIAEIVGSGSMVFFLESFIIFILIVFGLLFISMAIAGKVLYFYIDLYELDEKLKEKPCNHRW